jgi:hypothetical protein
MKDFLHRRKQRRYERLATKGKRPWGRIDTNAAEAEAVPSGGSVRVDSPLKGTISAVVTRADGTVEDLGVIGQAEGFVVE